VYEYATGDRYEGEWRSNRQHGHGTMHFANGDRYEGEWATGVKTRRGKYTHAASGDVYEGPLSGDGARCG
jgi:hypothetical protein